MKFPGLRSAFVWFVATVILFVPCVLAWGDMSFFAHPARLALFVYGLVLSVVALFSGMSGLDSGIREDRRNRWVFFPLILTALLIAYLASWSDRHNWWTFGGDSIRYLGLGVFVVGGTLRLWTVLILGHRFSPVVAIQEKHTLETRGIYGIIRHPSYLGACVAFLGWALVFRSTIGIISTLLTVPLILFRIRAEEAFLKVEFGKEYEAYQKQTWQLIPYLY